MGLGGISIWQLLIVLLIVVLLFGTKKLKSLGEDLGSAVRGFKKGLGDADSEDEPSDPAALNQQKSATTDENSETGKRTEGEKSGTGH